MLPNATQLKLINGKESDSNHVCPLSVEYIGSIKALLQTATNVPLPNATLVQSPLWELKAGVQDSPPCEYIATPNSPTATNEDPKIATIVKVVSVDATTI